MSFTKWYLPDPHEFAHQIQLYGPITVSKRRADAILGNEDSVDMLNLIIELRESGLNGEDVLTELSKKFPTYFIAKSS